MTIDKIEDSLQHATEIGFHTTDNYEQEPPAILLGFDNPQDGVPGYNQLIDKFQNNETTLIIFKNATSETANISIVSKTTGDAINIKKLKFQSVNLKNFIKKEPKDRRFILLIGYNPATGTHIVATKEHFSPLVIDKYEISDKL